MWQLAVKYPIESLATFITIIPIVTFISRTAHSHRAVWFFFFYLVIKLCIEIIMFYMASKNTNNLYLGNLLTIVGFALISKMFQETYESRSRRNAVKWMNAIFYLVVAMDTIRDGFEYTFRYSGFAQCVFITSFVIMYFNELVKKLTVPYLPNNSFFWICAGLIIFFAPTSFISLVEFYANRRDVDPTWETLTLVPFVLETPFCLMVGLGIFASRN